MVGKSPGRKAAVGNLTEYLFHHHMFYDVYEIYKLVLFPRNPRISLSQGDSPLRGEISLPNSGKRSRSQVTCSQPDSTGYSPSPSKLSRLDQRTPLSEKQDSPLGVPDASVRSGVSAEVPKKIQSSISD